VPTQKFPEMPILICGVCKKQPEDIEEYVVFAEEASTDEETLTASDYCWLEEGTLDQETGMFVCTEDYITIGQPSSDRGWKATRQNLQALGVQP
jgi:hypothetical protein